MIQKFEIRGVHMSVDENLHKYVTKKIGRLDKYLSKHNRESVHAEVQLKEGKAKDKNHCTCEVTVHLPHDTLVVKESTVNMFAAVDIVEQKLRQQLRKYKDLHHQGGKAQRHLFARFRRRSPLAEPEL